MIYCGLKLTHDGAIALIDNGQLVFSLEIEKFNNNKRYASIEDIADIEKYLLSFGYRLEDVKFIIDGWGGYNEDALAIQPRLKIHRDFNTIDLMNGESKQSIRVAQYQERKVQHDILHALNFEGLRIQEKRFQYQSFLHVTGHVLSAYCTSPFASRNESSYILVWDGGMFPNLYFFDVKVRKVTNLGPIFLLVGNIYTIFSQHFEPFKVEGSFAKDDLSIAGKVMAYIALGEAKRELFPIFDKIINENYDNPMGFANVFANLVKEQVKGIFCDNDILTTFHLYLEELLVSKLLKKISRHNFAADNNLCLSGGCALNIKWNSAVRNSGIFNEVFVAPFPNDSGSAIGMACAGMLVNDGVCNLRWDVYSGQMIIVNSESLGWSKRTCSISELARIIFETNEPIVFLNGRAELGPRALGNRSILASPTSVANKEKLNKIKKRESYRPVSPICTEEKAPMYFSPGNPDPFMQFDHKVREEWLTFIPAVCHLDGTARLQTVNRNQNPRLADLLDEYEKLSGLPILCNTSANLSGSGFFPDIFSATNWGQTSFVWCEDLLYFKN